MLHIFCYTLCHLQVVCNNLLFWIGSYLAHEGKEDDKRTIATFAYHIEKHLLLCKEHKTEQGIVTDGLFKNIGSDKKIKELIMYNGKIEHYIIAAIAFFVKLLDC